MSRDIYEHRHTFDSPSTRKEYIEMMENSLKSIPDHKFERSARYIYADAETAKKLNSIIKNHGKNI